MKSDIFSFFVFCQFILGFAYAQEIRTVRVEANDVAHSPAVISLGTDEYISISFDEMSHEFHHFYYRIEHCDAAWVKTPNCWESDYVNGNNGSYYVEDYQSSYNTSVLYTHYELCIPNEYISISASGNYRITFFTLEDGIEKPVLTVRFSVLNPKVLINAEVTSDTNIDINARHQQLNISTDISDLQSTRPSDDVRIVVMQNRRTDNIVFAPAPTSVFSNSKLEWYDNRALIFPAGNEFRKFEILDDTHAYMGVDLIRWHPPYNHAILNVDTPRDNYLYDEDINGGYIIRNSNYDANDSENDTESDYMLVHFTLQMPRLLSGNVYINGDLTRHRFISESKMVYDNERQEYSATMLLKQGYYNYEYLLVSDDKQGNTAPIEGNYYQTNNEYSIYVYHKRPEARYEELVGFAIINMKQQE